MGFLNGPFELKTLPALRDILKAKQWDPQALPRLKEFLKVEDFNFLGQTIEWGYRYTNELFGGWVIHWWLDKSGKIIEAWSYDPKQIPAEVAQAVAKHIVENQEKMP
jgi:hypothetical protein